MGLRLGRIAHRGPWRPGGEVGGERGQLGAGPRGERPACPLIQLLFGQPALRERGREVSMTRSRLASEAMSRPGG